MATTEDIELVIDEKLHANMRKHTASEAKAFDEDVAREGRYRESIKYWHSEDHLNLILDGRQRYEHWSSQPNGTALKAPECEEVFLPDWDAAREWVLRNQIGRRNLADQEFKDAVGELYNRAKKKVGRPSTENSQSGHISDDGGTAARISEETGVPETSVRRYGAVVEAKNEISEKLPILLTEIENGTVKISDSAIKQAAKLSESKLGKVRKNLKNGDKWNHGFQAAATSNGQDQEGSSSGKNRGKDGAGASAAVSRRKQTEKSPAKLVDELTTKYYSPLVKGVDTVAEVNGWKPKTKRGENHAAANDALTALYKALKEMRKGAA